MIILATAAGLASQRVTHTRAAASEAVERSGSQEQLDQEFGVERRHYFRHSSASAAGTAPAMPATTAAMALRQVEDAGRFGSVRVENDFVEAFRERPLRSGLHQRRDLLPPAGNLGAAA